MRDARTHNAHLLNAGNVGRLQFLKIRLQLLLISRRRLVHDLLLATRGALNMSCDQSTSQTIPQTHLATCSHLLLHDLQLFETLLIHDDCALMVVSC